MSVTDKTDPSQTAAITFELDLPHRPEKVWRALTEPALLSEWLLPVLDLRLEAGAAFTLAADPQPGWGGLVSCRFVEIETHRKLAYAWDVPSLETVVTFTLEPTASGTRLRIVQSGFKPDQKQNAAGARYGWRFMAGKLVDLLARIA
jgi:uncharacterized protein YndB with AHSA1/START domain